MTTSAARRTSDRRSGGFTLLEIIVVLAIIALVIGGGLAALYFNRDEARLNDAGHRVELLAKRARTIAALEQRPYALEFRGRTVALMPYAVALMEPSERRDLAGGGGLVDSGAADRDSWKADEDMSLLVMRWGSSEWHPVTNLDRQVWRFDPTGVCEPVGVRIQMEDNWMAMLFHPLTAAIAEVEMEVR